MNSTRINIFTGHFGSGKTEVSINFAMDLRKKYDKVAIVDLDIVNPYFRTKDVQQLLEEHDIKVVAPVFANTNVDIPALPAEIISVFHNKDYHIVFDVGGDDSGAIALGRYHQHFAKEPYHMFFVVNTKRPLTHNEEEILEMIYNIEKSSRLKVSSLINNTNLSYYSKVEDLIEGQEIIEKISREISIPIQYITGKESVLVDLPKDLQHKAFPIDLYLKLPWEEK